MQKGTLDAPVSSGWPCVIWKGPCMCSPFSVVHRNKKKKKELAILLVIHSTLYRDRVIQQAVQVRIKGPFSIVSLMSRCLPAA